MGLLDLVSAKIVAEKKVLFFSLDPSKKFTHFHYDKKTYFLNSENLKKLPKSFNALFISPPEAVLNEEHEGLSYIVDTYKGEISYIQYDMTYLSELEKQLLKHSKMPVFYPSLSFIKRLADGVYFEVYYAAEFEKWFLITYQIDDAEFLSRSTRVYAKGSEDDLLNEIVDILKPLPIDASIRIYAEKEADDLIQAVEQRFRSVGRAIDVQKMLAPPWTIPSSKGVQSCTAIQAEKTKKRFYDAIMLGVSIFALSATIFFEFARYGEYKSQIESYEMQLRAAHEEIQRVDQMMNKYAPILAYALPKEAQPEWLKFFKEVSAITPTGSRLRSMRVTKVLKDLKWQYSLVYEVEDLTKFKRELFLKKKTRAKLLKNSAGAAIVTPAGFEYELKGLLRPYGALRR